MRMSNSFWGMLALFAAIMGLQSCAGKTVEPDPTKTELISNTSFEIGGQPSIAGWRVVDGQLPTPDSNFFSHDTPPGGGQYSLKLYPGWLPIENAIEYDCVGQQSGIYKLSVWSKVGWGTQIGIGSISLARRSNGLYDRKKLLLNDTSWTQHLLEDTLSLGSTDTIAVILSAGATELVSFEQRFDKISLMKVR